MGDREEREKRRAEREAQRKKEEEEYDREVQKKRAEREAARAAREAEMAQFDKERAERAAAREKEREKREAELSAGGTVSRPTVSVASTTSSTGLTATVTRTTTSPSSAPSTYRAATQSTAATTPSSAASSQPAYAPSSNTKPTAELDIDLADLSNMDVDAALEAEIEAQIMKEIEAEIEAQARLEFEESAAQLLRDVEKEQRAALNAIARRESDLISAQANLKAAPKLVESGSGICEESLADKKASRKAWLESLMKQEKQEKVKQDIQTRHREVIKTYAKKSVPVAVEPDYSDLKLGGDDDEEWANALLKELEIG